MSDRKKKFFYYNMLHGQSHTYVKNMQKLSTETWSAYIGIKLDFIMVIMQWLNIIAVTHENWLLR